MTNASEAQAQPNILFIHTEHQRGDALGCAGHPVLLTPTMDTIAQQGARFTRFYSTCPSCIASRRSMLTGQLPQTHGLVGYRDGMEWDGVPTLPGILREQGYQTVHIGRDMHQHPPRKGYGFEWMEINEDYAEWLHDRSPRHGMDDWFGGGVMHNDWTARPWHLDEDLHATNWTVERALHFLKRRDPSRPFFLSLGFIAAHPPFQPPAFYMERYLRTGVPEPLMGDWAEPPDPQELGQEDYVCAHRVDLPVEALRSMRAAYYGLLNHVDDQLRRLLNPVKGLRHRQDTIIILTSDHGEMLGDHYRFRKSVAYEGSARVPFLISAPPEFGIAQGGVIDTPATHADLMPTLLDMLDLPIPASVDGLSLLPHLRGETPPSWRPWLHIEHAPVHQSLTDGREKFIWWPADGREQFFNLVHDPDELHDLSGDPAAADRLIGWRDQLIDRLRDRPEGFVQANRLVPGRSYDPVIPDSATHDVYVSPAGDDAWTGHRLEPTLASDDGPFRTLERARDAIRALSDGPGLPPGGITVHVRGGLYPLAQGITFGPEDAGTPDAPISYQAYGGETVRLIGGRRLDPADFKPVTDPKVRARLAEVARDHVMCIDLRACGITDLGALSSRGFARPTLPAHLELFFNDQPMTVAQWPNAGEFATLTGFTQPMIDEWGRENGDLTGGFTYHGDRPLAWAPSDDIWVHGYWAYDWANSYERVRRLDPVARVVETDAPHGNYHFARGQRFYFLNVLEELDQPGEYYVDRESGILYLWPPAPLAGAEVLVSTLPEPLLSLEDADHIQFRNLTLEAGRGAGIEITGGEGVTVAGCTLRNLGTWAITIEGGTHPTVTGCDIYGTGDGGIRINAGDRATLTACHANVLNNHLHHYARWTRTYVAGIGAGGVGMRIAHNLIHDAPHNAILFWGNDFTIEANEIYRVCLETGDAGAIYTGRDFTFRGNVIRRNFIHHMGGMGMGSIAIYMDDCVSGTQITDNVLQDCMYGLMLGGGRDFWVANNVFVDCFPAIHADARCIDPNPVWQNMVNNTMRHSLEAMRHHAPPYRDRYPEIAGVDRYYVIGTGVPPEHNRVERNICCGGRWIDPVWPKGADNGITEEDNLITDDAGFTDPEFGVFNLRPDSPAWDLGFHQIPMDEIGLRRDSDRAMLPPRVRAALRLLHAPEAGEAADVQLLLRNDGDHAAHGTAIAEPAASVNVALTGATEIVFDLAPGETRGYELVVTGGPGTLTLQVTSQDSWLHPARLKITLPDPGSPATLE
jgi:arylsulfatase A-like enzyme